MTRLLALCAILAYSFPGGAAYAAADCSRLLDGEFGCACAVPMSAFNPANTALLSNIAGNVDITTAKQYSPATKTVPLNVGDGVIVFENSSAVLTFGPACSRNLPAQSSLVVREIDGCACASLVEAQRVARSQNLSIPAQDGKKNGGAAIAALLVVGGGLAAFLALNGGGGDNGNPVTPQ